MEEYIRSDSEGKKTVWSGLPEFGYELIATLPYAYHLHMHGELKSTISGIDTSCLYWFSPEHIEQKGERSWDNAARLIRSEFPNINIHRNSLDWSVFEAPPLKQHYEQERIVFSKPTVVIANRKSIEWEGEPINFIDEKTLYKLFGMLHDEYQIVYLDPAEFGKEYEDHLSFVNSRVELPEDVVTIEKLRQMYPHFSLNELQCRLFSGCEKFISSNGGLGIFCSYFGGENIIFTKMCQELDVEINSFHSWYYRLSGAVISVSRSEDHLLQLVAEKWVKRKPLFNVLIHTDKRPNCFHDCIKSVEDQNYLNSSITVLVADESSETYVRRHPCAMVPMKDIIFKTPDEAKLWSETLIRTGYIIHLSDIMAFSDTHSLEKIANSIEKTQAKNISWPDIQYEDKRTNVDSSLDSICEYFIDISDNGCHLVGYGNREPNGSQTNHRKELNDSEKLNDTEWLTERIVEVQTNYSHPAALAQDKPVISVSAHTYVAVIVVALDSGNTLQNCLDSILRNNRLTHLRVLVVVDEKRETWLAIKKLTRRYDGKIEFYFSNRQLKISTIKASILKKIFRRDTLVMFLDSGCVLPPDAVSEYCTKYNELRLQNDFNGVLKVKTIYGATLPSDIPQTSWRRTEISRDFFVCSYGVLEKYNFFPIECSESDSDFYRRLDYAGIQISEESDTPVIERLVNPCPKVDEQKTASERPDGQVFTREKGKERELPKKKGITEPVYLRPIL